MAFLYPWGNTQQLNLDWILQKIKELEAGPSGNVDLAEVANALISATYTQQAYDRSDIVYRDGKLYRANQAIPAPGEAWTPAHWDEILLGDTVSNLVQYVAALSNDQIANSSSVSGTHTSDALNTLKNGLDNLNGALNTKALLAVNPCIKEARLIAHQGSTSFVQSSDLCFKNAIMQGFKILEGDVQKTSDNNFVIWHDTTVGGLTIASSTLTQIQALTLDYGCKVLSLEEFVKLAIENSIAVELDLTTSHFSDANFTTYAQTIYNAVKAINPSLDSVIWTINYQKALVLETIDPTVIICYSGLANAAAIGDNVKRLVKNSRLFMFSQNKSSINSDVVAWSHNNGVLIKAYTITTETELFNAFASGYNPS